MSGWWQLMTRRTHKSLIDSPLSLTASDVPTFTNKGDGQSWIGSTASAYEFDQSSSVDYLWFQSSMFKCNYKRLVLGVHSLTINLNQDEVFHCDPFMSRCKSIHELAQSTSFTSLLINSDYKTIVLSILTQIFTFYVLTSPMIYCAVS
jgi:hypothetical protein